MNHEVTDKPSLQVWDHRISLMERTLAGLHTKFTYRYNLGDGVHFLWSRRCNRRYCLILASPDSQTGRYEYTPFSEADCFTVDKYGPQLLPFFTRFMEYCELEPRHLW